VETGEHPTHFDMAFDIHLVLHVRMTEHLESAVAGLVSVLWVCIVEHLEESVIARMLDLELIISS
jgi:hypothetical protein